MIHIPNRSAESLVCVPVTSFEHWYIPGPRPISIGFRGWIPSGTTPLKANIGHWYVPVASHQPDRTYVRLTTRKDGIASHWYVPVANRQLDRTYVRSTHRKYGIAGHWYVPVADHQLDRMYVRLTSRKYGFAMGLINALTSWVSSLHQPS